MANPFQMTLLMRLVEVPSNTTLAVKSSVPPPKKATALAAPRASAARAAAHAAREPNTMDRSERWALAAPTARLTGTMARLKRPRKRPFWELCQSRWRRSVRMGSESI